MTGAPNLEAVVTILAETLGVRLNDDTFSAGVLVDEDDVREAASAVAEWFAAQQPSDGFQMLMEQQDRIAELEKENREHLEIGVRQVMLLKETEEERDRLKVELDIAVANAHRAALHINIVDRPQEEPDQIADNAVTELMENYPETLEALRQSELADMKDRFDTAIAAGDDGFEDVSHLSADELLERLVVPFEDAQPADPQEGE